MKLQIYIFLISINYAFSNILKIVEPKGGVLIKYPKKLHPGTYQINNGKYYKPTKTKVNEELDVYTVFPGVYNDHLDLPDSPYFPLEKEPDQKHRVKKVLQDFTWSALRSKRSINNKDDDDKKTGNKTLNRPLVKRKVKGKTNKKRTRNIAKERKRNIARKRKAKRSKNQKPRKTQKRTGKIQKHSNVRKGQQKSNLKYTKKIQMRTVRPTEIKALRSKLGDKEVEKLLKSRSDFVNKSKPNPKKDARRLMAARDALIEEYPYVVSIQKDGQHWCAGALLNPRLVITTANCLWKANRVSHMRIRAGSRHTDEGGQTARIQEVMKHPGWRIRRDPDNDVALVLLDRNIKFSDAVHGVDLPNRVMMPAFEDAWITSWGAERGDGIFDTKSNTLQVYHARVMDREKCNNITHRFGVTVTNNFICLAQTGKRAPCTRDTGAPAVSDGVLWGLASWGIRKLCGTERFPAMFSYLGSPENLDFIVNATHFLMADERFYPFPDRAPLMRMERTTPAPLTLPY